MVCATLVLSACGFHLRGSDVTQVMLPPTYLAAEAGSLRQAIQRALTQGGTTLVGETAQAQRVVRLLGERVDRRVLSVGAAGTVEEYELHYAVTYAVDGVKGAPLIAPETLTQVRSYAFSETEVLGKDVEQETLVQDMRRDAVGQILRRLQNLSSTVEPLAP